jgi:hypothetical protein
VPPWLALCSRIAAIATVALVGLYIVEDLSVRYRIPSTRATLGTVTVERFYAIPQKGGKTEFVSAEPELRPCVHAILPHLGYGPCWYIARRTEERIDM